MIIALWSVIVLLAVAIWACICSGRNYQDRIVSLEYRMEGMVHRGELFEVVSPITNFKFLNNG